MVATVTDEQFAARELVRDWARSSGSSEATRAVEQGNSDAWRPVYARLADLGLFGVAVPEDRGGAGGSIEDLCAMVEEAAKALVPGPVATTALATLVLDDPELLAALASGERFAGLALDGDVQFDTSLLGLRARRAPSPGCWAPPTAASCCCRPARTGCWSTPATATSRVCRSSRCGPPTFPGRWPGWC